MVFPAPGGPLTMVSRPCLPASTRSSIRGRGTSQPGRAGGTILEVRMVSSGLGVRCRVGLAAAPFGPEVIVTPLL